MADHSRVMREQIMNMLRDGKTRKEMADELCIGQAGIGYHIKEMMKQHNVTNSIELILAHKKQQDVYKFIEFYANNKDKIDYIREYKIIKLKFEAADIALRKIMGFLPSGTNAHDICSDAYKEFQRIDEVAKAASEALPLWYK